MDDEKEKAEETKTETPSSETEATAKEKAGKEKEETEKPEEKQDKADETSDDKTEENADNKPEGKPEKEAEKEAEEEEKPDETEKAMAALTAKYNALMIKDALTDAGQEYGLTRAQIPYIARMMDTEKLITENGEVNTKALSDQLKGIVSAFPGLKAKKEEKTGIQLGAPINTEEGSETFADRIMAAAGLK